MRFLYKMILITFGIISIINAQGITNTLGGSSSSDQFQIKNNNGSTLFTVTGDGITQMQNFALPTGAAAGFVLTSDANGRGTWQQAQSGGGDDGDWQIFSGNLITTSSSFNVGIGGVQHPQSILCVSDVSYDGLDNASISSRTKLSDGRAVYGWASDGGSGFHYGGYFKADGQNGEGAYGEATGSNGLGVRGAATGASGSGIMGVAGHQSGVNYGVYGVTHSPNGWAGYFNGRGYFSGNVGIQTESPEAGLDVNTDIILGESGTAFLEIRQISGYTSDGLYTYYPDKLPEGWIGAKTRVLSLQLYRANDSWYTNGYVPTNTVDTPWEPDQHGLAMVLQSTGRAIGMHHPDFGENMPWVAIIMRMP